MKIFGDDGFRDIFGNGLMNEDFLNNFFFRLNQFLKKKKTKEIIIGYDTRKSYKKILKIISKNINEVNNFYVLDKPVSTPCLSYLSNKFKDSFLIMITASHFSKKFNGFKFFYKGKKLEKADENKILKIEIKKKMKTKKNLIIYSKKYQLYENFINSKFDRISIKKKILIDFANGSAASSINNINFFKNLDKKNFNYNFNNINLNCGSNFLKKTSKKKTNKKYEYILAFDGDADRIAIFKKNYGIIESEKIALIFALYLRKRKNNQIISTLIANPGLKKILKECDLNLIKTNVGDRNVTTLQEKRKAILGFETSGHYSFMNFMDGIFSAGYFLKILANNEKLIIDCLYKSLNYKLFKVNLKKNVKVKLVKRKIKINKNLKIILRKSIWEQVYRLYIFYKKEDQKSLLKIKKLLKSFI